MFNPEKPVRTRDGRKARIICTDAKGDYPIIALVQEAFGQELAEAYTQTGVWSYWDGAGNDFDQGDLINIEEGEDG